jgi:hypothetical protein
MNGASPVLIENMKDEDVDWGLSYVDGVYQK